MVTGDPASLERKLLAGGRAYVPGILEVQEPVLLLTCPSPKAIPAEGFAIVGEAWTQPCGCLSPWPQR